jgi:predicted metal-dependent phosphoesterase TrpH
MYKYDLHVHTKEGSACARNTGAEMAEMYAREGYSGFFVTDHFYTGNTAVPRDLPWEEWVGRFCEGYRSAKKRGDELGLDVFFGWEFGLGGGTEFLTLGLDEAWLLANPDVCRMDPVTYSTKVHEAGGYLIHAHPYLEASYVPCIRLFPRLVDAVEVLNAPKGDFINARASEYALAYDLTQTAGSDSHNDHPHKLAAVSVPRRPASAAEFISMLRGREHSPVLVQG